MGRITNCFETFFVYTSDNKYIFIIIEFISLICPGIIWFYYGIISDKCNSPIDGLSIMILIFYGIFLLLFIFNSIVFFINTENDACHFRFFFYFLIALVLEIIMIIKIQKNYTKDWNENECSNLKSLTLFWLIINYIKSVHLFIGFLSYVFNLCGIIQMICGADDYD